MNKKQEKQSAYSQIVNLCKKHGIIASTSMTEDELRVVLDSLCTFLTISCPEQDASKYRRSEKENPK